MLARAFDPAFHASSRRLRAWPAFVTAVALLAVAVAACGCASSSPSSPGNASPWRWANPSSNQAIDIQQLQSALMTFSDDMMYSVSDACGQIVGRAKRPESQAYACTIRLGTAIGAMSAATSPNPVVGVADLLTLVTLQRMALEEPAACAALDEPDRLLLHGALVVAEDTLWTRAETIMGKRQLDDLRELIVAWRAAHPHRVGVSQVRLTEFAAWRQTPLTVGGTGKGSGASVLRLLQIDPLQGLDPTTRQLQQSRLLGERVAFWAQRMPVVLGWQSELTAARILNTQVTRNLNAFSDPLARMATSYEMTLEMLPAERHAAIDQIDRAATTQASAIIDRTAAAFTAERKAAVEQAGDELSKRLTALVDRVNDHLQSQSRRSLDHAADAIAIERKQLVADAEAASQRIVDRLTMRLVLVLVSAAVIFFAAAIVYRRHIARPVESGPPFHAEHART